MMNEQQTTSGTVRISLKERCVCISMEALRSIGCPKYVQFFVNRDTKTMFIWGHDTKVEYGLTVKPRVYTDTEFKCRMNKTAFAEAISTFCGWDSLGKYQLYGTPYADRVMRFSLKDAERLDCDAEV